MSEETKEQLSDAKSDTPATDTSSAEGRCADCKADIAHSWLWWHNFNQCAQDGCGAILCSKCANKHPLIVYEKEKEHHDLSSNDKIQCYCRSCFQQLSTLDFSRNNDLIVGPSSNKDVTDGGSSGVTFIFAHGGGGSRAMFHGHATILAERYGHKSILLDLPGHGANVDTPLTLDSCATVLKNVFDEHDIGLAKKDAGESSQKIIYVGGSLGAYVGFHLLHEFREYFSGAILLDCGQNVGPGASYKATAGLWFLNVFGSRSSNKSLMGMMLSVAKKSPADYKLVETSFGSGMFFEQAGAQVECLKSVAPAEYIPRLPFPMLFMNGSEDYRDSEHRWLNLCAVKENSELKVYEGGDHFFTHDTRFLDDMIQKWDTFATVARASS